jgi:hypothetical protein
MYPMKIQTATKHDSAIISELLTNLARKLIAAGFSDEGMKNIFRQDNLSILSSSNFNRKLCR